MYKASNYKQPKDKLVTLGAWFFGILTLGGIIASGYVYYQKTDNISNLQAADVQSATASQTAPGIVAKFDSNGNKIDEYPASLTETVPKAASGRHMISLPSGWGLSSDEIIESCNDGASSNIETYTNGSKTIRVYINGFPEGCDNSLVADTYIDYDFTPDNKSIKTARKATYELCTREQNQACPKGDGTISAFIGDKLGDGTRNTNQLTGKSYAFEVSDSKLEADLNAQLNKLLDLVDTITFISENQ